MNHTIWTWSNNAAANWDHFVQDVMGALNAPVTTHSSALVMALTVAVLVVVVLNSIATIRRAEAGNRALEAATVAMRVRRDAARARREQGERGE